MSLSLLGRILDLKTGTVKKEGQQSSMRMCMGSRRSFICRMRFVADGELWLGVVHSFCSTSRCLPGSLPRPCQCHPSDPGHSLGAGALCGLSGRALILLAPLLPCLMSCQSLLTPGEAPLPSRSQLSTNSSILSRLRISQYVSRKICGFHTFSCVSCTKSYIRIGV